MTVSRRIVVVQWKMDPWSFPTWAFSVNGDWSIWTHEQIVERVHRWQDRWASDGSGPGVRGREHGDRHEMKVTDFQHCQVSGFHVQGLDLSCFFEGSKKPSTAEQAGWFSGCTCHPCYLCHLCHMLECWIETSWTMLELEKKLWQIRRGQDQTVGSILWETHGKLNYWELHWAKPFLDRDGIAVHTGIV